MVELVCQTFDLGSDKYGRKVRAICRLEKGQRSWTLKHDAHNRRDDEAYVSDLTDDMLKAMGEAVARVSGARSTVMP